MAIGDVGVRVVPDAENFWNDFRRRTEPGAVQEGRRLGRALRAGLQEEANRPIHLRAEVDTARARAELATLQRDGGRAGGGLLKALIPLAPALVPLGAAAAAAGAGLVSLGAAGVVAVTGLKKEMEDATATGNAAALSVSSLKSAVSELQRAGAQALLPGVQASVDQVTSALPALDSVIRGQSLALGEVISNLTRGTVGGLKQFAPLLDTIASSVVGVTGHFAAWATGPGGASFAQTLAHDYAAVAPSVDAVAESISHVIVASNSTGLGIVSLLGTAADVVNSFPTVGLEAIIAGFVAFKGVGYLKAGFTSASAALTPLVASVRNVGTVFQFNATRVAAASAAQTAAVSAAAAETAAANLAEARAAQTAALQIVAAREGVGGVYSAQAQVIIASAEREVAAYAATAEAATTAAAAQAEAAAGAAAAATASRAALLGILGVAGVVAVGVFTLTDALKTGVDETDHFASSTRDLTAALAATGGALDSTVRAKIADQVLSNKGIVEGLQKAHISLSDFVSYASGTASPAIKKAFESAPVSNFSDKAISDLHDLYQEITAAKVAAAALNAQFVARNGGAEATRAQAAALHTTAAAYVAAEAAAAGNTDATRQQTLAFQLANDAASLFGQALDRLAGRNLGVAQAQTAYAQSLHTVASALHENGLRITGNSTKALANQQVIQGSVEQARQLAEATAKQTGSSDKAAASYRNARNALIEQLRAHHQLTPALQQYVDKLFDVRGISDYLTKHPTKLDADHRAALAKIRDLRSKIAAIKQGHVPGLDADTTAGRLKILELQWAIDRLQGKTITITTRTVGTTVTGGRTPIAQASGGYISGPGSGTSDSIPAWLSNGEFVVRAAQTAKHRRLLESINGGMGGYAAGGVVGYAAGGRVSGTDISSFLSALGFQVSPLRQAQQTLLAALRTAKASTSELARATRESTRLTSLAARIATKTAQIEAAQTRLANLRSARGQEASTVANAFRSTFDITNAGVRPQVFNDVATPALSASTILSDLTNKANSAATVRAELAKLRAGHLNSTLYQQLAENPEAARAQIDALSGSSRKQLASISAQFARLSRTSAGAGADVAGNLFDKRIDVAENFVTGLRKRRHELSVVMHDLAGDFVSELRTGRAHTAARNGKAAEVHIHGVTDPHAAAREAARHMQWIGGLV